MTKADEFRQYAEEAMRWARQSKTEYDRAILLYLARIWMSAARDNADEEAVQGPILLGGLPSLQNVNDIVHFPQTLGHLRSHRGRGPERLMEGIQPRRVS
jgi:hypothetical protein